MWDHRSHINSPINNYRETFLFANLDKNADSTPPGDKDSEQNGPVRNLVEPQKNPARTNEAMLGQNVSELPILVGNNQVARIPFPMSEEDFDLLIGTLQLWKKRIVKSSRATDESSSTTPD
jgi:hypothetical protein